MSIQSQIDLAQGAERIAVVGKEVQRLSLRIKQCRPGSYHWRRATQDMLGLDAYWTWLVANELSEMMQKGLPTWDALRSFYHPA